MTQPASRTIIYGADDAQHPGKVIRLSSGTDWISVLEASQRRARRDGERNSRSGTMSNDHSSHMSVSTMTTAEFTKDTSENKATTRPKHENREAYKLPVTGASQKPCTVTPSQKIRTLLAEPSVNLDAVKNLAWAGLHNSVRASVWKILLGYLPTNTSRRNDTLQRKRLEYREAVKQHYLQNESTQKEQTTSRQSSSAFNKANNQDDATMHQISIDIPRTCPGQSLFHIPEVEMALQRVLYVWATRHPASGYVQGMNDLVTPFFYTFLAEYAKEGTKESIITAKDLSIFEQPEEALANAEADSYWCLTSLLNDIQDYYTFSQPGIQRRVHFLRELVARVDHTLCTHLEDVGLDFLQFAFRWMNCLLMRELPFPLIVRVWDTYLAETEGFATFHVYVCAALLVSFSDDLLEMDFQDLVMFLQNLPTQSWTGREIDVILSQAYMWRTIFGAAPKHLQ